MKIKGFTLIELLTVLVLLATLSLFIVSAAFLNGKNERQVIIDQIRNAIQYAKIQAVILGHPVYLSPYDYSAGWSKGMKLFQHNKTNISDPLYQWEWHHPLWNIAWSGINSPNKIILSNNPINAISNGHFVLFNSSTKERFVLTLNRLGRLKINKS